MKHCVWRLFPILLLLVFITGCGQDTQELSQSETALQSPTAALNIPPSKPPVKADRPPAQAPPIEPKPEGTPSAQAADISKPSSEAPQEMPDALVVGAWMLGMLSGGQFNADTGKYEGGASGMGQIYTFKARMEPIRHSSLAISFGSRAITALGTAC